jgi:hypothetical protein
MKLPKGTEVRRDGQHALGRVLSSGRKWATVRFANVTMRLRISELEVNEVPLSRYVTVTIDLKPVPYRPAQSSMDLVVGRKR